ncbi:MAG: CocE/NonD family hydrolase [Alphaproteobacteria bacterium]|nr:CocE/NonD family hydrolase [Alphaproteobacteria bacterium]
MVSAFPRDVREIEHTLIPLSDGTRLAARLWLPADAERNPVPAILEYLPYRKRDGTHERDALTHPYLAGHGYACVRVDIRGSGESEGLLTDEYARQEQDDALEVIAWLARQPWCTGAVGMMGISWGGFNALQVAAHQPPALKAIVSICSTDDRYADDVHYMGGARLGGGLGWASFFFRALCHPPDPLLVGEQWRAMWHARLANAPLPLEAWLKHQRRDAYWKHGSICEDYGAVKCPTWLVGGWTDGYTNAIPRMLEHLSCPRKGLIGPWAHAYPHFAKPGPQIGFLQEMLRWWDHWLKGIDTGVMDEPMLRAWMTKTMMPAAHHETLPGHWVEEPCWPPADRKTHRLFLTDDGLATETATLTPRPIVSLQTVGKHAGEWCPFGAGNDQADDQHEDDARSLVFETPPLDRPLALLGAPELAVEITSDKPIAYLVARLCDVHPSGESLRVSYGLLNLAHRDSHETPSPLTVGQRYRVRIKLNDLGFVFPAGHRIRLALSTTYWPLLWPGPEAATVTILGGALDLPLLPERVRATPRPFPEPETAPPEKVTPLGSGAKRIDRLGLELATQGRWHWHIEDDDPTSAIAELGASETIARDAWKVRIETSLRVSCTPEAFLLNASLRAWEGDDEACSRTWDQLIPRDCL